MDRRPLTDTEIASLPWGEYAFPGPLRDQLVGAILAGTKTTTSSLVECYERDHEALPHVGMREAVVDSANRPVAVTEIREVEILPLSQVSDVHAHGEGEGFASYADWRIAHEAFWTSPEMVECYAPHPIVITDSTLVVCVRFELLARL